MAPKNRVKVSICDATYSLVTDDNEEPTHVFQAAMHVDSAMRSILKVSENLADKEKAAILVALQNASLLLKAELSIQMLQEQIEYLANKIDREIDLSL